MTKNQPAIRLNLEQLLTQKAISRYELAKRTGIKYQTIDNYYKNKVIRYDTDVLLKICLALDCGVEDVIKLV
jgi:putative transcriptional regulator